MLGRRPANTPIKFNCKLGNSDDKVPVDEEQYQLLMGKLIYLSHNSTRYFFYYECCEPIHVGSL